MAKKTVPAAVKTQLHQAILGGAAAQPQLAHLVQHVFDLMGGERGVAKALVDEFHRKDCTPATRARILALVMDAMASTGKQFGSLEAAGQLTDEDLERELNQRVKAAARKLEAVEEKDGGPAPV